MQKPEDLYRAAVDALNRGQWSRSSALANQLLSLAPSHAGVHFVAGVAALQQRTIPVALRHLHQAVLLNPGRADYGAQLSRALAAAGALPDGVKAADAAMALAPGDPMTLDTLGVVYTQAGEHEKAAQVFRAAVAVAPDHASFRFNLATSLMFSGDVSAAEEEYEACLARDPSYWKAHLAVAQLRRQEPGRNHLARLRELLAGAGGDDATAQMYLHLSLAKELEDMEEFAAAFDHLVAGKRAGGRHRRYDSSMDARLFDALARAFDAPVGETGGHESSAPIFVMGMPRSGTTLVDRILSSHSDVHSSGELQDFGLLLKRLSGSRTPALLDPGTVERGMVVEPRRLGDAYLESTRARAGGTPRFVDKLPHNFLYAGFIARAFPNARMVCLRRDPMDTCLSNFRQLFTQGSSHYDYSFDLLDTGRYYLMFDRLVAHWRSVLPGRVLEISYEAIVDDQERSTRDLLEFCGLPWQDACLRFEENAAPVATASVVQVRSPIYRSAIQRWKRYGARLADLQALLEENGVLT